MTELTIQRHSETIACRQLHAGYKGNKDSRCAGFPFLFFSPFLPSHTLKDSSDVYQTQPQIFLYKWGQDQ